ncbi:MAG: hypothetical protein V4691_01420 [Pseudomonadota bacterium]
MSTITRTTNNNNFAGTNKLLPDFNGLEDLKKLRTKFENYVPKTEGEKAFLSLMFSPKLPKGMKEEFSFKFKDKKLAEGQMIDSTRELLFKTDFLKEAKELGALILQGARDLKISEKELNEIPLFLWLDYQKDQDFSIPNAKGAGLTETTLGIALMLSPNGSGAYDSAEHSHDKEGALDPTIDSKWKIRNFKASDLLPAIDNGRSERFIETIFEQGYSSSVRSMEAAILEAVSRNSTILDDLDKRKKQKVSNK